MTCSPDSTLSGFVKMTNGGITLFVDEVNHYRGENAYIHAAVNKPKSIVKISIYGHLGSGKPIYLRLLHNTDHFYLTQTKGAEQHGQFCSKAGPARWDKNPSEDWTKPNFRY